MHYLRKATTGKIHIMRANEFIDESIITESFDYDYPYYAFEVMKYSPDAHELTSSAEPDVIKCKKWLIFNRSISVYNELDNLTSFVDPLDKYYSENDIYNILEEIYTIKNTVSFLIPESKVAHKCITDIDTYLKKHGY